MRAILFFACVILSEVGAVYAQPLMHGNSDAVLVIITVTTVFAGFLVAIITVLGDPAMIPEGSWRQGEVRRDNMESRLIAHVWLFILYLVTIAFLFAGVLLDKAPSVPEHWKIWIERAYLFFGILSFLFTFALPGSLMKLQLARWDAEIKRRREGVGLKD